MIRHVSSTPSCRVKRVAVADHRRVQQHLVGRRALAALVRELHVEQDRRGTVPAVSARCASSTIRTPVEGSSLITSWFGSGSVERGEAEPRRVLEDEPHLGLRHREPLARCG